MNDIVKCLLCVDDEPAMLSALRRLLREEKYTLLTATSGQEALELMSDRPVQVVMSDQRMLGMSGIEFLQKVRALQPDSIRVILSGYAEINTIIKAINTGEVYRFLLKPWNDEELRAIIRQCFAQYDLLHQYRSLLQQVELKNKELQCVNRQLAEEVVLRTRSLELSRTVLALVPTPLIGIDEKGIIVMLNEAVRQAFRSTVKVFTGMDIQNVFPAPVLEWIRSGLHSGIADGTMDYRMDECDIRMQMKVLKEHEVVRGALLVLELASRPENISNA